MPIAMDIKTASHVGGSGRYIMLLVDAGGLNPGEVS